MTFSQLSIGLRFRIIEPDPTDPKVYLKVSNRTFVDAEFPDGMIFGTTQNSGRFKVSIVHPDTTPSRN